MTDVTDVTMVIPTQGMAFYMAAQQSEETRIQDGWHMQTNVKNGTEHRLSKQATGIVRVLVGVWRRKEEREGDK